MPISAYQWCAVHRTVEQYPPCIPASGRLRVPVNTQVSDAEAAAVAIHPQTGEKVYCFASPTDALPEAYAREGFVKHQFKSARELESFCRQNNLVNDMEYGNKHDGAWDENYRERSKADEQRRQRITEYHEQRREYERREREGR